MQNCAMSFSRENHGAMHYRCTEFNSYVLQIVGQRHYIHFVIKVSPGMPVAAVQTGQDAYASLGIL